MIAQMLSVMKNATWLGNCPVHALLILHSVDPGKHQDVPNQGSVVGEVQIRREIEAKSRIPVVLPMYYPFVDKDNPLYLTSGGTSVDGYNVMLSWVIPCAGGNTCFFGEVAGSRNPIVPSEERSEAVTLAGVGQGKYYSYTCGSYCSEGFITWKQDGYYYSIGIKAGDEVTLVKMVNSAIRAKKR